MRFDSYKAAFAILRFGDGRPFKVDAVEAAGLPDRVYEYNDTLFELLSKAFEQGDRATLESLWSTAHRYTKAERNEAGPETTDGLGAAADESPSRSIRPK